MLEAYVKIYIDNVRENPISRVLTLFSHSLSVCWRVHTPAPPECMYSTLEITVAHNEEIWQGFKQGVTIVRWGGLERPAGKQGAQ